MVEPESITKINICDRESCFCCVDKIYSSMNKQELEWEEMEKKKLAETPLHRAAAAGNTAVAVEILNLAPSLGRKLNGEGLSPLHIAIKHGKIETARTLASFDKQAVRVKGRGGETPLMLCAAQQDYDRYSRLLASFLVECPDAVLDVNNKNQTVVHVALEKGRCDAACVIVDWLRRTDQISSVLSVKDADGNTALHTAAKFGCFMGATRLVHLMKLNRRNSKGNTALDVAEYYEHQNLVKLLESKGTRRGKDLPKRKTVVDYVLSQTSRAEAISRAYYYLTQELTLEMRGTILVVAALITAATYQVVLQPPAGVYPPHGEDTQTSPPPPPGSSQKLHVAGQMVMRWTQYHYFMPLNTFAFALSAVIIIFVVPGTPIFLILHLCLLFMCLSYILALDAISYYTNISNMIYFMAMYAILGAFIVKLLYYPAKALLVEEDWWLRRFSIKFSNFWAKHGRNWATPDMSITFGMKKQHRVLYRK